MRYHSFVILYQYPGADGLGSVSPPCLKVWLALRRIGAEHRVVNCRPHQTRRISRTGRLPVLELEDGTRVHESVTILDALEQRFPDADLFPRDPLARARDRLWDHYATDVMYWFGFYCRWMHPDMAPRTFRAFFGRMPAPARLLVRATFARSARRRACLHGIGKLAPETVERAIERTFETVEIGLEGGPFLGGRPAPARGDLSCAALYAQIGFRKTMPGIEARFHRHIELPRHVIAVLEACGTEAPSWLRSRRDA